MPFNPTPQEIAHRLVVQGPQAAPTSGRLGGSKTLHPSPPDEGDGGLDEATAAAPESLSYVRLATV
jgi:hypothetical protein